MQPREAFAISSEPANPAGSGANERTPQWELNSAIAWLCAAPHAASRIFTIVSSRRRGCVRRNSQFLRFRTTMGKNLRPLERLKYVKITPSPTDGRSRTITLTNAGGAVLKAARHLWRRAQADFETANGSTAVGALRATLTNLKAGP